ncbi:hypothetical protein SAY87_003608 [Trapa incisa]|uniref:Uncharacterized protein n=1 Tax=Trapa incisa TaxID=236973 RepID=A0AAN7QHX3_9MYRT|nr:hypothetical protein SAY87_003608 [Trapa incisa]
MGNSTSCAPSILRLSGGAAKVLLLDGRLQFHARPITAGELMVENPGKFVCRSGSLKVGHRIVGLSADDALEPRCFYFLLPMDLLYSVLTCEEMSAIRYRASKSLCSGHGSFKGIGKILPVCIFTLSEGGKGLDFSGAAANGSNAVEKVYSKQRSWKPALETILES